MSVRWAAGRWGCVWAVTGSIRRAALTWVSEEPDFRVTSSFTKLILCKSPTVVKLGKVVFLRLHSSFRCWYPERQQLLSCVHETGKMPLCAVLMQTSGFPAIRLLSLCVGGSGFRVQNSQACSPYVFPPQGPWRTLSQVLGTQTKILHICFNFEKCFETHTYFFLRFSQILKPRDIWLV